MERIVIDVSELLGDLLLSKVDCLSLKIKNLTVNLDTSFWDDDDQTMVITLVIGNHYETDETDETDSEEIPVSVSVS